MGTADILALEPFTAVRRAALAAFGSLIDDDLGEFCQRLIDSGYTVTALVTSTQPEPRSVTEALGAALTAWLDSHGEADIEERLADAAKGWLEATPDPASAVVPDVEDGPITVPIESAGYPAHYRHGWRDAMAAIRAPAVVPDPRIDRSMDPSDFEWFQNLALSGALDGVPGERLRAIADKLAPAVVSDVEAAWGDELALVIAKARFGPGVDMGGKHNPRPSEVKAARQFVADFEAAIRAEGRGVPAVVPDGEAVDAMARVLMAEWERVEGPLVGTSHVATFADLARAAIRAEGRRALDEDVQTLIANVSPYQNCRYKAAFRAECPEVNPSDRNSWCKFCQVYARLLATSDWPRV